MKKYKVGYTQGVYDMFHIGHLNLLNNAKNYCDYLVVGVNADELVEEYKHKKPVIGEEERRTIVENIKAVDKAIIVHTLDKIEQLQMIGYNAIFIGDDWKGTPRWVETERLLKERGVDLVFLPYTQGVSSTILRTEEKKKIEE